MMPLRVPILWIDLRRIASMRGARRGFRPHCEARNFVSLQIEENPYSDWMK